MRVGAPLVMLEMRGLVVPLWILVAGKVEVCALARAAPEVDVLGVT